MGKMSAIWMKAVIQSIKASSYTRITPNSRKNNPLTHQVWNEVHVALRAAASGLAREAFVLEKVKKPCWVFTKHLKNIIPGPNVIKLFKAVIYECSQ
jgi:hypothetical protein